LTDRDDLRHVFRTMSPERLIFAPARALTTLVRIEGAAGF
jgi:hypothetical protein